MKELSVKQLKRILGGKGHSHDYYNGRYWGRVLRSIRQTMPSGPISIHGFQKL